MNFTEAFQSDFPVADAEVFFLVTPPSGNIGADMVSKSDPDSDRTLSSSRPRRKRKKTPMYQQLKTDLEEDIRSGKLKPGEKVPSESDLIAAYHVSGTTARRCLDELERDGLLQRRQGKGTYVSGMANVRNRRRVAIVIKDLFSLAHPFLANVVGTIEHALESAGVHVVVIRARSSSEAGDAGMALYDMINHEGTEFALILSNMPLGLLQTLVDHGINCLGVNTRYLDDRIPNVSMDYAASFSLGLEHLVRCGHRHIVFLTQEPSMKELGVMNSASFIQEAFFNLRDRYPDLDASPHIYQVRSNEDIAMHIDRLLVEPRRATAVICWDELAALEVMRVLSDRGIRVPQDMSVVGSKLLPSSPVACVDMALTDMAKRAVEMMLAWMDGMRPQSVLLPPNGFLTRETIAPVE